MKKTIDGAEVSTLEASKLTSSATLWQYHVFAMWEARGEYRGSDGASNRASVRLRGASP